MASQTISAGRTSRTVKPLPKGRNRFERGMWLFMRYSGIFLVFLALSHFWIQHLLIGTQSLSQAQTVAFWGAQGQPITVGQFLFRLYYVALLVLAMGHGLNGLRQVAYDYLHRPAVYMTFMVLSTAVFVVFTLIGAAALAIGAQAVAR